MDKDKDPRRKLSYEELSAIRRAEGLVVSAIDTLQKEAHLLSPSELSWILLDRTKDAVKSLISHDLENELEAAQRKLQKTMEILKRGPARYRSKEDEKNPNADIQVPETPSMKQPEEIIEKGSLYQKAVLYLNNLDSGRTFKYAPLTEEQADTLRSFLYSDENYSEGINYTRIYNSFQQYAKWVEVARVEYQREAAALTGKLRLLERITNEAERMRDLAHKWKDQINKPLQSFTKSGNASITLSPDGEVILEAVTLKEEIAQQAERTAHALSKLKAFIEPLSDFLFSQGDPPLWPILPRQLEVWIELPDAIPEQTIPSMAPYFRYLLNRRKKKGEQISPEEEEIAVFPDYNEVEIDQTTLAYAKQLLEDTFYIWEVQKRKNKKTKKGSSKKAKKAPQDSQI